MADRTDAERAADVPKVEREAVKASEAAKAAKTVVPPAPVEPEEAKDRAEDLVETEEAEEVVEEARFRITLDPNADFGAEDGPVALAFPGSGVLEEADEDGRLVLDRDSGVEVSAETARNAEGVFGVVIEEVTD